MAGVIGTRKFAYDVWGDTVNIAARLEAASQPNRVLEAFFLSRPLDDVSHPQVTKTKPRAEAIKAGD